MNIRKIKHRLFLQELAARKGSSAARKGGMAKRRSLSLGGPSDEDDEDDYEEQDSRHQLPTKGGYYEVTNVENLVGGSKSASRSRSAVKRGGAAAKFKNKFKSLGITNRDAIVIYFDGYKVDFVITSSNTIITNNDTDLTELFSASGADYERVNIEDWLPHNIG